MSVSTAGAGIAAPFSFGEAATPMTTEPALSVNNIEVVYDHVILVLRGVSLTVPKGGIVALLGANGAGKTTTLKAISNLLRAERGEVTKGSITFQGTRVDRLTPNELVRRGCIQVLEGRLCFGHLTIEENLLTGAFARRDGGAAIRRDLEMVYENFPLLRNRRRALAGYASGGEQQMCAIGRAMMSRPSMVLLDEPSMGLAPQIVREIFEIVRGLNRSQGVSFLLAEQNANLGAAIRDARLHSRDRPRSDGRRRRELARERRCEGILSRRFRARAPLVPRRQKLSAAQALAGVMATDHYDALETRDPAAREAALFARLPAMLRAALNAPGWRRHLGAIEPSSSRAGRRWRACRCFANPICRACRRRRHLLPD